MDVMSMAGADDPLSISLTAPPPSHSVPAEIKAREHELSTRDGSLWITWVWLWISDTYSRLMPSLTRDEAAYRARLLHVDAYRIDLDLTLAVEAPSFASVTTIRFS